MLFVLLGPALDCTAADQPTFHAHFGERLRIGCALENDLVVTDTQASRKHAVIKRAGEANQFSYLGSGNGTLFNGVLIG
jgi:pSer/pThr/pTyr-binding forkhead associated (FHA) protein